MDYEKAYKDALERAKQNFPSVNQEGQAILEDIFPELKGSEDEKVRSVLLNYFKDYKSQSIYGIETFFGLPTDSIIAWFEKQKHQEPANEDNNNYLHKGELLRWIQQQMQFTSCDGYLHGAYFSMYKIVESVTPEKLRPVEDVNGADYGIDSLWHAQHILETTLGEVDGYQSDDGILEHKAAITAVRKIQKQWTKEDEDERKHLINMIEGWLNTFKETIYKGDCEKGVGWLKSLGIRFKQRK